MEHNRIKRFFFNKMAETQGIPLAMISTAVMNRITKGEIKKTLIFPAFAGCISVLLMDFSLLSPLEFFVVPKNGDGRNNKPPAMRVRVDCYTKNHLSVYNRVVQAVLQKGKVIYGEERKFTCAYEMDVQISYRLHT